MNKDHIYKLALSIIPGIGGNTFRQLISYLGSAQETFKANPHRIKRIPGIGDYVVNLIRNNSSIDKAQRILESCEKKEIRIIFNTDKEYPIRLKDIYDSPPALYRKGNYDFKSDKVISIVGTRTPSKYGLDFTEQLIADLKEYHPCIVSGFAYGIDIQAHKNAIENDLSTVAVLAGGLDRIYPSAHKTYLQKLMDSGCIISENPPGVPPDSGKFPARNRIIAGMSDAVIVIEAAKKGGALITAHMANDYNKEVFALPGNVYNTFSEGCNNLIKKHKANLISSVHDLEYYLNWDIKKSRRIDPKILIEELSETEKQIFNGLNGIESLIIDELSWKTQIPMHKLAGLLLEMEFKGLITSLPGKKYSLSNKLR